ncbi:hypothetical protein S40288_11188 [Stachybotrys chartarum IBT 40288]|nr:hypothetical protein S40288_11188 [Stachybotrys chartarum IBT 40288]
MAGFAPSWCTPSTKPVSITAKLENFAVLQHELDHIHKAAVSNESLEFSLRISRNRGPLLALRTLVSLTTVAASDRDALTTALSGYIKDLDIAATLMQGFGVRCHSFVERILFVNFVTLERINGLSIGGEARSPSFLRVWNALTALFGFGKNQIRGIETLYIYLEHTKGVIEILQRIQASTEQIAMAFDDCGKSLLKVEEKCDRFLAKTGIAFIEDQSSSVANVFSRMWSILGSEMFRIDDQRQMLGLLGNITTEIEIGRGLIVDMKAHLSIVISQLEIVHQGLQQSLLPTGSCPRQC